MAAWNSRKGLYKAHPDLVEPLLAGARKPLDASAALPKLESLEVNMTTTLRAIVYPQWSELKGDLPFFGTCGVAVGALHLLEHRFNAWLPSGQERWSSRLLTDFLPFEAIALVWTMGLLVAAMAAEWNSAWLVQVARQVSDRLRQVFSVMSAFLIGYSLVALVHFVGTGGGLGLTLVLVSASAMLLLFFMGGTVSALIESDPPRSLRWLTVAIALVLLATAFCRGTAAS